MEQLRAKIFQATSYRSGFTLIELIIVLAIMALFAGTVLPRMRDQLDLHLRKHARQLSGSIRFLYNQSAMKNKIYRLHYDLDNQKYWVEKSESNHLRLQDPEQERSAFEEKPKKSKFSEDLELLKKPVELQKKITFKSIKTQASEDPITSGHAYTHFFPSGFAEPTTIKLQTPKGVVYSIVVNSLTGSAKVYPYDVDEKK